MRSPIRTFMYALLGLGDYDAYCAHVRACRGEHDHGEHDHGGEVPMTRAEFIRNREARKFAAGRGGRCC